MRNKIGDIIWVTNGKGLGYKCQIIDDNPKKCELKILSKKQAQEPTRRISLAICPTKNSDRLENLVEKGTEIGLDSLYLIQGENSERKTQKTQRLERKAIAALKQSLQFNLPEIHPIQSFSSFVENCKAESKLIAHLSDEAQSLKDISLGNEVLVLIGPEGDFSHEELEKAKNNGFLEIELGKNRLRTETAGIMALSILNYL